MQTPTPQAIKDFRKLRKMSRAKLGELCGVDYATVANWELARNKPKGATLEKLNNVIAGKLTASNLTAAEEALLERVLKEGGFKSREEFLGKALLALVARGTLIAFISLHCFRSPLDWTTKALGKSAEAGLAMISAALR